MLEEKRNIVELSRSAGGPGERGGYAFRLFLCAVTLLIAALGVTLHPESSLAGTSGNAIVRNTITVNYNDALGVAQPQVAASIDLVVNTVSAPPTVSFLPGSGSTDGTGSTATYTVRVTTNSNGPRLVALSVQDFTASTNMQSKSPTDPSGLAASVFLGATMVDPSDSNGTIASWQNGATLTFKVPNDGGAPTDAAETGGAFNDGVVNGLKAGDTVYLFTDRYYGPFQVGTVSDPAPGSGSTVTAASIQLTNISGATLTNLATAYAQIVEFKDLSLTVTQGTVADATAASNWTTTVTATMAGPVATSADVLTASHMGRISVAKLVRNVTTSAAGSGPYTFTINGGTNLYYTGGVTGKPGEVLEYLVVASDIGTGDAQGVYVTDTLPRYTSLMTGASYGTGGTGTVFARALFNGLETSMSTGKSGLANVAYGAVSTGSPPQLQFWLGTGCSGSSGGTLNSSFEGLRTTTNAYLVYQVKIN
ncbi:hypothetical protein [Geomonas sp.]|uniref:hypothetical protein n=1 Tax=Geomonas sp. TaxID=2651584 RepID=UPI002B49B188|nr:hypothetical protein [Geomonas sp.]HJV35336.1 hypothetical protein [Geomonas sp.]